MSLGHLDAYPTVPTGGWPVSVNTGGGATTVTIPAGTYEGVSALLTEFANQLTTTMAEAFTVTIALTETTRTALVTIDRTAAGNWTLTWTTTALRTLLGFTGNLSGANSYTGTNPCLGIWAPDCQSAPYYGNSDPGYAVRMMTQTRSGTGIVKTVLESTFYENPEILWSHVSAPLARTAREGSGTTRSFESWLEYTQAAGLTGFTVGSKFSWYPSSDSASHYNYRLLWDGTSRLERAVADWDYLWAVRVRGIRVV